MHQAPWSNELLLRLTRIAFKLSAMRTTYTASHWGTYRLVTGGGKITEVLDFEQDSNASAIGQSFIGSTDDATRIARPMVRAGWLEHGPQRPTTQRGKDDFVPVSWERALDLAAGELDRVRRRHGNSAIFAGSYGWASAGRFHHAQSHLKRFLNCIGGFTYSQTSYSYAAAEVLVPHVLGSFWDLLKGNTSWDVIAEHSRMVVMFGGMALKNAQVNPGGVADHNTRDWLQRCKNNGVRFVNISPLADDAAEFLQARWLAPRPNTDTALMLGMAHTLVSENRHDRNFLQRYCTGFDQFLPYLLGTADGQPKDADWAAGICAIDAEQIRALARDMAGCRSLLCVSWSLQRSDHGEQSYWMAITLAAMLGQIGLPGGGFGCGYASVQGIGNPGRQLRWASLAQNTNPVADFIPVARISDLLLHPGGEFDYNGQRLTYPDIRLVYWAGGNPFHHQQDLNRLLRAWQQPETVIVNECRWNALARHADIILPVTTTQERNDIACDLRNDVVVASQQALAPHGQARDDYAIFSGLAKRLGVTEQYTEGRSADDWLRYLYSVSRQRAAQQDLDLPDFDSLWETGCARLPPTDRGRVYLQNYRRAPDRHPLQTPSGKIEIFSRTIHDFDYPDCPGHPVWLQPAEWLGSALAEQFPLHLISNQPYTRLHSQLDQGSVSRASKIAQREPVRIHPRDAGARGIRDGDVVRVFNDRGACLAGAVLSEALLPGVIQLATGAWYDPQEPGCIGSLDKHGNPNVLTLDKGSSKLSQAPISHSTLVEIEPFKDPPPVSAFHAPEIRDGEDTDA